MHNHFQFIFKSKNYNPDLIETLHLGNGVVVMVNTPDFLKRWPKIPKIFNKCLT